MKKNADKGKSEGGTNMPKQRKTSSKNGEIETYLSSYYQFRYNTVLGRTEYRSKNDAHFSKVGRYEINTLRREIDNDIGIITSSDNLYSIIESSFSPRINPIQEYFKALPLMDISRSCGNTNESNSCRNASFLSFTESHSRLGKLRCGAQLRQMATVPHQMARGSGCQRNGRP